MRFNLSLMLIGTVAIVDSALGQNVEASNRFAWAENVGWTNWRPDLIDPVGDVIVHETFLEEFLWGENIGWINLDDETHYVGVLCDVDLNGDCLVNPFDLAMLLGAWGTSPDCTSDLNDDGLVNAADLALLLGAWGGCP